MAVLRDCAIESLISVIVASCDTRSTTTASLASIAQGMKVGCDRTRDNCHGSFRSIITRVIRCDRISRPSFALIVHGSIFHLHQLCGNGLNYRITAKTTNAEELFDNKHRCSRVADQVTRDSSTASQALFPTPLPLSNENQVDLVIVCDSQQTSSGITVQDVEGDIESLFLQLCLVGFQLFHCLSANRLQQLVVLLGVDGEGAGDPGGGNDVCGEYRAQEDMRVCAQEVIVEQIGVRLVSCICSVQSKEDLGRSIRSGGKVGSGYTDNLLCSSFSRNRSLFERVRGLEDGCLGNVGDVGSARGGDAVG